MLGTWSGQRVEARGRIAATETGDVLTTVARPELTLSIPASVLSQLGWTSDTVLSLDVHQGSLVVRPLAQLGQTPKPVAASEPAPAPEPAAPVRTLDASGRAVLHGAAARVFQIRMELGFTRTQMAIALDCPYQLIGQWEDGWSQPEPAIVDAAEAALLDPDGVRAAVTEQQPER
jgi:DNA-binding XRE family transcriptional regulator